jgi:iron complex transport system permease protein
MPDDVRRSKEDAGHAPAPPRPERPSFGDVAALTPRRLLRVVGLLGVVALVSVVGATLIGPVPVDLAAALSGLRRGDAASVDYLIVFETRLPRVLLAAVVGGSLGVVGTAFQALLRNPLACPHVLGVSGGAAVTGIAALILAGAGTMQTVATVPAAAFAGAVASTFLIHGLARVGGRVHPFSLLLVGVIFNAICAAVIMFVNALGDFYQSHGVLFWIMGNLSTQSYTLVAAVAVYSALGAAWLMIHAHHLNLLSLGDEGAAQLGVDVERTTREVFVAAALMVGVVVSVSGMISFVGLIVPHALRLVLGSDHRLILPASALGGAAFLVWADTAARTVLGPTELPVGVVTAVCGGPLFVWLLRRESRRMFQ